MATIKLKNSQVKDRIPQPGDLDVGGELAVNHHADNPGIFLKDTAGVVRKIAGTGAVGATDATTTAKGVVQLADAAAVTAGTAGLVVDAAQLKAAVAAEDLWDRTGTTVSPTNDGDSLELTSGGTAGVSLDPGTPTSPLVRDSSGRLLVGTASETAAVAAVFQGSSAFAAGPGIVSLKLGSTNPSAGNNIGQLQFRDASSAHGAQIIATADANWSAGSAPTRLSFSTTPSGSATPVERMRIRSTGEINAFAAGSVIIARSAASASGVSDRLFYGFHSATSTLDGTASFVVYTNGDVKNTNNSYGALSDIKLKENIVDAKSQWDDIKGLRLVNYNFKAETGAETHKQLGLIAQEVEQVCPGLVGETKDTDADGKETGEVTKSVAYSVLYMKAVGALQEAMARIEDLEAKVKAAGL